MAYQPFAVSPMPQDHARRFHPAMRRLLAAVATASLLLAQAPVLAEGNADDIGVMSVSLKDSIKPRFGFQGQTQGAGTPNEVGVGGFLPFAVGENSVWFLDSQVNANFEDFTNYSSNINTTVAGTTFSTSSRLGYRWLNGDRSWMYGINAGYDTRPMATGYADTGVSVKNKNTVFFQQAAVNLEAVSNSKSINAYALLPTGTKQYQINSLYQAGSLNTYGFDAGYNITPELTASVGYYYQDGDSSDADGSGVKARLAVDVTKNIEFGGTYTYDDAFESRASADLTIRFGGGSHKGNSKAEEQAQIKKLSATPGNRNVRVHDCSVLNYTIISGCDLLQIEKEGVKIRLLSTNKDQIFFKPNGDIVESDDFGRTWDGD